jgi:hypothetical protein
MVADREALHVEGFNEYHINCSFYERSVTNLGVNELEEIIIGAVSRLNLTTTITVLLRGVVLDTVTSYLHA